MITVVRDQRLMIGINKNEQASIHIRLCLLILATCLLTGCVDVPEGTEPVKSFVLDRYLGRWYEIARLDHSFERGLSRVTADYSLRDDGGIKVLNRGFDSEEQEWKEAIGKGYFTGPTDVGQLKVSFFGPFYGAYNIIMLDKQAYQYAMVSGSDYSYLWILARSPNLAQDIIDQLVARAEKAGFPVKDLIFVAQD